MLLPCAMVGFLFALLLHIVLVEHLSLLNLIQLALKVDYFIVDIMKFEILLLRTLLTEVCSQIVLNPSCN